MENVKDKLKKEEYRNWVKSTLGLEQTNKALYEYVKTKFLLYTHGMGSLPPRRIFLTNDEHMHIRNGCLRSELSKKVLYRKDKGDAKRKWRWTEDCKLCKTSIEKISSLHTKSAYHEDIFWKNSNNTSSISLEWTIAKIFMPKGNEENNTGPDKTDPQAMFQLMLSCVLFRNVDVACLEELTIARNKLLHSSDNVVGDREMKIYFKHMKVILREATKDGDVDQIIRDRIAEDVKRIKKLNHAEMTMALFDDALKVKRKGIFDEFERSLADNDPDVLKELLKLATNTVEEIQQLKTHAEYKAVAVYCKMENKNLSNDLAKLKVSDGFYLQI